ncbi:Phosphoribosylformylglycinamidine synthase,synthetase subunit / Phosphoribosylformylglycinamidine synthase, glutamine amidotransferase subunit [Halanaerobium saccharolyticum subsp. saccharolyticum DSM 6643]|uniref:Phosphoribosylformylglycinamidine synthase,synthetase subunit / Phosphoribosylformylglycinamidine synthase, glutamine amidotransferase subunit n=1 Tax=Halanaerobium saccharolyticum subsp. saccharolyticum DSM 6643 TaxID=1293054 RepID=M5E3E0_9FIRM|nr:phosphoribosylformylglycinamidine synthase [Halanaerobium saccharolyticum]CCU80197.1 Phosphoribosylformylglycinamidine synthase,synthetase subunit / Phosphoribosylformylglycinamidine synthase, glutamine amidotransferase subunit [Halanaerobium saccharolyticum subsp. saccharolyticum DSM 6643]
MADKIRRVFVEKKEGFDVKAEELLHDFRESLELENLEVLRLLNRYDITNISETAYKEACETILAELPVDIIYQEEIEKSEDAVIFAVEYLPGQYDQRADSAEQCIQILNNDEKPTVRVAQIFILKGDLSQEDIESIKDYYINPVDSREAALKKPESLEMQYKIPEKVKTISGFIKADENKLRSLMSELGLAMSMADLKHCQKYFRDKELRNPTITEIRVLDTYWSDHCRHTTFLTKIENVEIEESKFTKGIKKAYQDYLNGRQNIYQDQKKDICLMDIALMGMKELRAEGKLEDLEISNEVNAASIEVTVDVDGRDEDWLIMFKNETHNHPTEIEPFGGAATCLGGAIRDPLSGRSYVYQAMRVTGAGDPRTPIEETLEGKLPQKKIVQEASDGYSSYGNQIGLATGMVNEIYNERYLAKHMEIGAVIAAAPKENVVRGEALPGDMVILLGGKTGRDGCGGATGSSKVHTEDSIEESSAEVQKGNPPTERKIQRLFRNPKVSKKIKVCNDFGAGGVSVAIGELADALEINLNAVPKKYEGLDGTELAISESQERMAVVIEPADVNEFIELAAAENLEATVVAEVKDHNRLIMDWNGNDIVNLSRTFLDTNGATQKTAVRVSKPIEADNYFKKAANHRLAEEDNLKEKWISNLADINVASQKGLVEKFDSSIGAGSVTMPFGGKYQLTPTQAMTAKIPLIEGETNTGTIMSHGYDSKLTTWSPFHGALYAVVESVAKIVASGGDYTKIRFTFQEYFERLRNDPERWGKPFSALLGAYKAQKDFELPAIGGKDSMSGTFKDIDVPPTLVSFAVDTVDVNNVISPEFKEVGSTLVYLPVKRNKAELPDISELKNNYTLVEKLISKGKIKSAAAITIGGLAEAISKMSFGNKIGVEITTELSEETLFSPEYGALILEVSTNEKAEELFVDLNYQILGKTVKEKVIRINNKSISLVEALNSWEQPLEKIYKTQAAEDEIAAVVEPEAEKELLNFDPYQNEQIFNSKIKLAKPKVLIPVFPGTNCEYDSARQFREAGAEVETFIFKNLEPEQIENSIARMAALIRESQIVMLPGGFSAGDEPDGSGKFIAAVFRNPEIKKSVMELLNNRDGLMLGICNGFQALVKLGLLPYGEIREVTENSPTLTYNTIGRHVSQMVNTKITSNKSPWLANVEVGEIHSIPVSHGEGRFVAEKSMVRELQQNGQLVTQYVDLEGKATMEIPHNPNGSIAAVEGICSPDGRIFGKMGHSERIGNNVAKNIIGEKDQKLFKAGVDYFTK